MPDKYFVVWYDGDDWKAVILHAIDITGQILEDHLEMVDESGDQPEPLILMKLPEGFEEIEVSFDGKAIKLGDLQNKYAA